MRVCVDDVRDVLKSCFGPDIDPADVCANALAEALSAWNPQSAGIAALDRRAQDLILRQVFARYGNELIIPGGRLAGKLRSATLAEASDCLLALALMNLPEQSEAYEMVREWAMQTGSLSALICLSERFADFQTPDEQETGREIVRFRLSERETSTQ